MSSTTQAPRAETVKPPEAGYAARLLLAVDSVLETRGLGVKVLVGGRITTLRGSSAGQPFVLINLRPPLGAQASTKPQAPPLPDVSVGKEWANFALNLGGATLSWIGVAGTAAVAPETGGASLIGTTFLWTGAVASSVSVGNSIARLTAIYTGHASIVAKADKMCVYTITNDVLDLAGIAGAGSAFKEAAAADKALGRVGVSTWEAASGKAFSRPMRRRITEAMALQGAKRVAAARITLIVRLKLIDAFAAAYGVSASSYAGGIHDIAVLIVHPNSQ